jgi:hypothetical protein
VKDSAPYVPGSHTSKDAARRIAPRLKSIRFTVYEFIRKHPGVTDAQIRRALRLNTNTARPRRIELERRGLIKWTGKTKRSPLGASAQTWMVTGLPYPEHWAEGPQTQKTRSGEARIRRALDRAFPSRTRRLHSLIEELIAQRIESEPITKTARRIRAALRAPHFVALLEYVLR